VPFDTVVGLLEGLPALELRRALPAAQLTDLVAKAVMGKSAPEWRSWLPSFAQTGGTHPVPDWVREDVSLGVRLRVVSQELFDAFKQLGG
jgi:hypothetical protein